MLTCRIGKGRRRRIPSLESLVGDMKKHPNFDPQLANAEPSTIARRIRATWKPRRRR
jgi:hypothetical protein